MEGRALTEGLLMEKAKGARMDEIVRINLWGCQLSDITCLEHCSNLKVVSLTDNMISSLKPLRHCTRLEELYLRKNSVSSFDELDYLTGLSHLKVLWIAENPVASLPNYREQVVRRLPRLYKLDEENVTSREQGFRRTADDEENILKKNGAQVLREDPSSTSEGRMVLASINLRQVDLEGSEVKANRFYEHFEKLDNMYFHLIK